MVALHAGRRVPDEETNPLCSVLKLSGVVRREGGLPAGAQPDLRGRSSTGTGCRAICRARRCGDNGGRFGAVWRWPEPYPAWC